MNLLSLIIDRTSRISPVFVERQVEQDGRSWVLYAFLFVYPIGFRSFHLITQKYGQPPRISER
jgi:hypothetical protein